MTPFTNGVDPLVRLGLDYCCVQRQTLHQERQYVHLLMSFLRFGASNDSIHTYLKHFEYVVWVADHYMDGVVHEDYQYCCLLG